MLCKTEAFIEFYTAEICRSEVSTELVTAEKCKIDRNGVRNGRVSASASAQRNLRLRWYAAKPFHPKQVRHDHWPPIFPPRELLLLPLKLPWSSHLLFQNLISSHRYLLQRFLYLRLNSAERFLAVAVVKLNLNLSLYVTQVTHTDIVSAGDSSITLPTIVSWRIA